VTPPLRVDRVAVREIRVPLERPFEIASGAVEQRRLLLLEVAHPDGLCVWSECVAGEAPDYSPETVDTARLALLRWFVPRLLDVEMTHPAEAFDRLRRSVRGHRMAAAALEMGVWALWAELTGRRLTDVLGGRRSRIQTGVTLTLAASPEELVAEAREALAQGYRKIKVKIAPGRDVDRLRALRRELGAGAPIAADANGSYRRGRMDRLEPLDELGLLALEQPFEPDDLLGHARLQERLRTPVALDESVTSLARAQDMVWLESGRALNLKPGRVGGFAPSLAIEGLCRRAGIPMWCGGMLETGLGRAYNAALAALPGFELPGDIYPPDRYLTEDIVTPGWTTAPDGTVGVPTRGPGLGVDVDRDRVENLTVWKEES
jgi:O-succinylbenzoate synthase